MDLKSLSDLIKREREKRGLNLTKINEDTKIPIKFLEYIEEAKWEGFPNQLYKKAVLKKYLDYLKIEINVENLFNKNEELKNDELKKNENKDKNEEKVVRRFYIKGENLYKILFVVILFFVFLILFLITYLYLQILSK